MDDKGIVWILVDILESKSLLSKDKEASLCAFVKKNESTKKGAKPKIVKMSFKKFSEKFTPFLHRDKSTIAQILSLEELLSVDAIRPPLLEGNQ